VGYTPGVLDDCVADLAFALLLDARGLSESDRFVRRGDWSQGRFGIRTRASGKRLGIFGMGRIGSTVARASGFDMEVAYHNRRPVEGSPHQYLPSLLELARWADILVITAAGGEGTRHLVNAEALAALARRASWSTWPAAAWSTRSPWPMPWRSKRIAGAGLDVFEDEPRPCRPCWPWTTWCWHPTSPAARTKPAAPWPTWCCTTCSSSSPRAAQRPRCPGPPRSDVPFPPRLLKSLPCPLPRPSPPSKSFPSPAATACS
jgi:hypothetical protein